MSKKIINIWACDCCGKEVTYELRTLKIVFKAEENRPPYDIRSKDREVEVMVCPDCLVVYSDRKPFCYPSFIKWALKIGGFCDTNKRLKQ